MIQLTDTATNKVKEIMTQAKPRGLRYCALPLSGAAARASVITWPSTTRKNPTDNIYEFDGVKVAARSDERDVPGWHSDRLHRDS